MKPVGTIIGTNPEIDVFELKKQVSAIRGKPHICALGPGLNLDRNLVLLDPVASQFLSELGLESALTVILPPGYGGGNALDGAIGPVEGGGAIRQRAAIS